MSKYIKFTELLPPVLMILLTLVFALAGDWVNCFVSFVGTAVSLWYTVKGVRERISRQSPVAKPVDVDIDLEKIEPLSAWKRFFLTVTGQLPKG